MQSLFPNEIRRSPVPGDVHMNGPEAAIVAALGWLIGAAYAIQVVHATGTVGATRMTAIEISETAKVPLQIAERVVACRYVGCLFLWERNRPAACPASLAQALPSELATSEVELVYAIALDARHGVKGVVLLAKGGTSSAVLRAREVLVPVLRLGAVGFALAHNHPSGDPTPSEEDVKFTNQVAIAAARVGLTLVDHLIVASGKILSFFEEGLLLHTDEIDTLVQDAQDTSATNGEAFP